MTWKVEFTQKAEKTFKKLDKTAQKNIDAYIHKRLTINPLDCGENLRENLQGLRRYRIGDYRLICEIQEDVLVVLVVKVGHRKNIYQ